MLFSSITHLYLFPYSAGGTFEADSQSFLFTLVNPSGSEPTTISQDGSGGIWCHRNWGPTFGSHTWFALCIWHEESSGRHYRRVFTFPPNANPQNFFAGENPFEVNEMEVLKVDF